MDEKRLDTVWEAGRTAVTRRKTRKPIPKPPPTPGVPNQSIVIDRSIVIVCFDLGDEWDDWGDFDDENLVNASEMPYQTNTVPTVQQSVNYSVTGFAAASASALLNRSQVKPRITRTPLRSISPTLNPGPSLVTVKPQNRLTLDWNIKRPIMFQEGMTVTTPEILPNVAPTTRGLDFFSHSLPSNSSSSINRSTNCKEEEAFLGIFDGLF
ncbi:uncharacterized protein [Pseudochaenichthys georgianus]|uniref:uncharacterized protein n=1 Tax=Pseudochaenichthys georgianus TaxID=52239 RepID=UPI0039C1165B